ncbi:hypothetical protein EGW03_01425 [bacterium]|jgi:hypothetical protein|nr:hypothetical protein [bacterium]
MYNSIDIKELNKTTVFLHYTDKRNVKSIFSVGLLPKIGKNSKNIELNKKVFFTEGFENTLFLMDSWIKWLVLRPKSNFIYKCGCFYMTHKIFPKIVVDLIFKNWIKSDKKVKYACEKLDNILKNSVFLKLDLVENVDFSYSDIDEVKNQSFSRKQLGYVYTCDSDVSDSKMELWNMHTLKDKIIEPEKIKLIEINNNNCAKDIVLYMVYNTDLSIEDKCPFLVKYLNYLNYNQND